jgi:hypothetical protein
MPLIDYQIHFSDLIVGVGFIAAFIKVFVSNRDVQRDLVAIVKDLRMDVDRIDRRTNDHHEWLIAGGLDRRGHADRRV